MIIHIRSYIKEKGEFHIKKRLSLMITFLLLSIILVGCSTEIEYISKDKALDIAKEMNQNGDPKYEAEFNESYRIDPTNNEMQPRAIWIVTASYPFGNRTVMYIDAYTGRLLSVAEIEPPQSEDDSTILQDIKNFKIHSNSSLEFEAKLKQNGFIKDTSSLEKLEDNINFTYSIFRKGELNYIHFQFKDMEERKLHEFYLTFDTTQTSNPIYIYSNGLTQSVDQHHFEISNTLNNQWIGIFFRSKTGQQKDVENKAHGELTLQYDGTFWRGNF